MNRNLFFIVTLFAALMFNSVLFTGCHKAAERSTPVADSTYELAFLNGDTVTMNRTDSGVADYVYEAYVIKHLAYHLSGVPSDVIAYKANWTDAIIFITKMSLPGYYPVKLTVTDSSNGKEEVYHITLHILSSQHCYNELLYNYTNTTFNGVPYTGTPVYMHLYSYDDMVSIEHLFFEGDTATLQGSYGALVARVVCDSNILRIRNERIFDQFGTHNITNATGHFNNDSVLITYRANGQPRRAVLKRK